jgi:GNAT superfamily N-acetyltransferase
MYKIRLARPEDFNFVANSYLKSYRTAPETKPMINEVYFPEYKSRLEHMARTGTILVACAQDDEDQIFGYSIVGLVGQYAVLHYVYVKFPFRHVGIGKALTLAAVPGFAERTTVVTHQPRNWAATSTKYKLIYDPKYAKETK